MKRKSERRSRFKSARSRNFLPNTPHSKSTAMAPMKWLAGEKVDLKEREIVVYRIELLHYEWPRLDLEIECGSGTYIRSIARDIGEGSVAAVWWKSSRTRIGIFSMDDAIKIDQLNSENALSFLRPAADAVDVLPKVRILSEEVAEVAKGREIAIGDRFFEPDPRSPGAEEKLRRKSP